MTAKGDTLELLELMAEVCTAAVLWEAGDSRPGSLESNALSDAVFAYRRARGDFRVHGDGR